MTLALVDPAARELVADFPLFDPAAMGLAAFREAVENLYATPESFHYETLRIDRPPGLPELHLLVFRPPGAAMPLPGIFYLHGGGFVAGSAAMMAPACAALARDAGAVVIAADYRLAPETPFPGPVEDCYAAFVWSCANARELGIDADRIAVMGQSAGGGLAAALTQLARDRHGPRPGAQFLVYPMLDARTGTPQAPHDNRYTGQFVWTRSANRFGWQAMLGGQDILPARLGHFSPAQAAHFEGLPRAFVAVGSVDLFLEENAAYTLNLSRAGVPVEFHVYPGGVHGFDALGGSLANAFRADLLRAISRWAVS